MLMRMTKPRLIGDDAIEARNNALANYAIGLDLLTQSGRRSVERYMASITEYTETPDQALMTLNEKANLSKEERDRLGIRLTEKQKANLGIK